MSLKEILQKIVDNSESILFCDSEGDWQAGDLLNGLSERMLRTPAHLQPGLYLAEINQPGYLGRVTFRIKPQA